MDTGKISILELLRRLRPGSLYLRRVAQQYSAVLVDRDIWIRRSHLLRGAEDAVAPSAGTAHHCSHGSCAFREGRSDAPTRMGGARLQPGAMDGISRWQPL